MKPQHSLEFYTEQTLTGWHLFGLVINVERDGAIVPVWQVQCGRMHPDKVEWLGQMTPEEQLTYMRLHESENYMRALRKFNDLNGTPETWVHLKSGGTYRIVGTAMLQASGRMKEYEEEALVIYQNVKTHEMFARPEAEWYDGRFVAATHKD